MCAAISPGSIDPIRERLVMSVEVLAGLSSGEFYATHNSFILKAELGKNEAAHGE